MPQPTNNSNSSAPNVLCTATDPQPQQASPPSFQQNRGYNNRGRGGCNNRGRGRYNSSWQQHQQYAPPPWSRLIPLNHRLNCVYRSFRYIRYSPYPQQAPFLPPPPSYFPQSPPTTILGPAPHAMKLM
ncbi:unnamed protein product [Microthlaspi erraticum]|uniref:Uncharacterized protein n=1 Tax=Microthlaspi erraticum TaxID=1685480 RepID=A0A6D2KPB7_9BRAS|nr:unnamed protein product [Microthlaspi erraticum]